MTKKSTSWKSAGKYLGIFLLGIFFTLAITNGFTLIESTVSNAVQFIKQTVFTDSGLDTGTRLMDINAGSGYIWINTGLIDNGTGFNLRFLALDVSGNMIYAPDSFAASPLSGTTISDINAWNTAGNSLWTGDGITITPIQTGATKFQVGEGSSATGVSATAMGTYTNAIGNYSTAMGNGTTARGFYSVAMSNETVADGNNSVAMGYQTATSGESSFAMGSRTVASGATSTALGSGTHANGDYSTTMGYDTTANGPYSLVVGKYNVGFTTTLFEIGIGTGSANRINALTIRDSGDVSFPMLTNYSCLGTDGSGTLIDGGCLTGGSFGSSSNYYTTGLEFNSGTNLLTLYVSGSTSVTGFIVFSGMDSRNTAYNRMINSGNFLDNRYITTGININSLATTTGLNCATGEVAKYDGSARVCNSDLQGSAGANYYTTGLDFNSGTNVLTLYVSGSTSVTGLIVLSGMDTWSSAYNRMVTTGININNLATTTGLNCATGEIVKYDGSAWVCSGDLQGIAGGDNLWTGNGVLLRPVQTGEVKFQVGESAVAGGFASIAVGQSTTTNGTGSIAIGYFTTTNGESSTAIGYQANAEVGSLALGYAAHANGTNSTAIGIAGTSANGVMSTAIGILTVANGNYATAMGYFTKAYGSYSLAIGNGSLASGSYSTALGYGVLASGTNSLALGSWTNAIGNYSTAIGYFTTGYGSYSTAMGWSTFANGIASTTMGANTVAQGNYSTAMGYGTTGYGDYSTAMGYSTTAIGAYSTTMGRGTVVNAGYSTAMGWYTTNNAVYSLTIGKYNVGHTNSLFEIGMGVNSTTDSGNALTVRLGGGVQISNSDVTCDGVTIGTIKFSGDAFWGCISTGRKSITLQP